MNKILCLLFCIALLYSCSSSADKKINASIIDSVAVKKNDSLPLNAPKQQDDTTFKMNEPGIIFLWPDDTQIEKLKSKDSDAFYTGADDYSFYNSQIMELADSLHIKTASTSSQVLEFITNKNIHIKIVKSNLEDSWWGTYLFNGVDTPKLQGTIEIDKQFLQKFFNK
jgi:hypothetical protein